MAKQVLNNGETHGIFETKINDGNFVISYMIDKVDKNNREKLSTEDYTTAEKTKLT